MLSKESTEGFEQAELLQQQSQEALRQMKEEAEEAAEPEAAVFEEDVENTSRNLRAMIEPIALVFVGVVVGGMLIALYVPMLTASTSIGS